MVTNAQVGLLRQKLMEKIKSRFLWKFVRGDEGTHAAFSSVS